MDLINNEDEQAIDVTASIADMMTVRTNPENEHFDDSSRMLLQGLTLYVADAHAGNPRPHHYEFCRPCVGRDRIKPLKAVQLIMIS
ncbi:hypothetical protein [Aestuariicoccus sp. MJ-SS9]|uniref:hypothetical protein n=1 Tax=Aestuariicoccus sp. MJ-SS9 TaxID=3079855 RepID=UPI00290633EE|nr:hypothetical protein [Aestuariicoccus sp. MJ-SS9]MDU8913941.1 hypothetical protein [Aestuariicoccus sp. MJ-SS9]